MLLLISYMISLCLNFFIYKIRMILAITAWRAVGKNELVNIFRVLRTITDRSVLEPVVYSLNL